MLVVQFLNIKSEINIPTTHLEFKSVRLLRTTSCVVKRTVVVVSLQSAVICDAKFLLNISKKLNEVIIEPCYKTFLSCPTIFSTYIAKICVKPYRNKFPSTTTRHRNTIAFLMPFLLSFNSPEQVELYSCNVLVFGRYGD